MSVIFILAPVAIAAWPAFVASASAAAAAFGFRIIKQKEKVSTETEQKAQAVEVELEESELLADKLKDSSSFSMVKDDVTITFYVNNKNKFAMHVSGKNKTNTELHSIGRQLYNKIKQQYAYTKLTSELKKKGYNISQEEVTEEGSIKIKLIRY